MKTQMIPFDNSGANVPAHIANAFASKGNAFGFTGSGGFPVLSLKGKVFTINRGGVKTLVSKPGEEGEPAASLEVVILGQNPEGAKYARTFYDAGYVEGNNAKPTCFSNDGDGPHKDSLEPQAKRCMLCPQNVAGSGASSQNPKAKACRSSKLLAIAPAGQISDPMLLRVPGTSLIKLNEYGQWLHAKGIDPTGVITRIKFDYSVAFPALEFKAIGYPTADATNEILKIRDSDLVKTIIGVKDVTTPKLEDEIGEAPATLAAPKPAAAKPAPKAAPAPADDDDDLPTTPKAKVSVEEDTPAAKPAKKQTKAVVAEEGLEDALGSVDFDD